MPHLQGHFWCLDPIDGTKGFVGMRQYAVCLGLVDQGQVCFRLYTSGWHVLLVCV